MAFEKIQSKPREYRQKLLFVIVGVIMILVIGGWIIFIRSTDIPETARPGFLDKARGIGDFFNQGVVEINESIQTYQENKRDVSENTNPE